MCTLFISSPQRGFEAVSTNDKDKFPNLKWRWKNFMQMLHHMSQVGDSIALLSLLPLSGRRSPFSTSILVDHIVLCVVFCLQKPLEKRNRKCTDDFIVPLFEQLVGQVYLFASEVVMLRRRVNDTRSSTIKCLGKRRAISAWILMWITIPAEWPPGMANQPQSVPKSGYWRRQWGWWGWEDITEAEETKDSLWTSSRI